VTVNALRSDIPEHQAACDKDVVAGIFQVADCDDEIAASKARAMQVFDKDAFSVITGTDPHERLHLYIERTEPRRKTCPRVTVDRGSGPRPAEP
jgi:hypothetical protein